MKTNEKPTVKVEYKGDLRTRAHHVKTGEIIFTDAPVDNHGLGRSFSPTDLLAGSLLSCMLTIISLRAKSVNWSIEKLGGNITKKMAENPRRVKTLTVEINVTGTLENAELKKMKETALNCPVSLSLSSEIEVDFKLNYNCSA